jgi:hypothetical protein
VLQHVSIYLACVQACASRKIAFVTCTHANLSIFTRLSETKIHGICTLCFGHMHLKYFLPLMTHTYALYSPGFCKHSQKVVLSTASLWKLPHQFTLSLSLTCRHQCNPDPPAVGSPTTWQAHTYWELTGKHQQNIWSKRVLWNHRSCQHKARCLEHWPRCCCRSAGSQGHWSGWTNP